MSAAVGGCGVDLRQTVREGEKYAVTEGKHAKFRSFMPVVGKESCVSTRKVVRPWQAVEAHVSRHPSPVSDNKS